LIDSLPASDKSFSKLLCDAPCLPEPLFRLLEGLCMSQGNNQQIKDSEGDRVAQCLGTVWSLILGRPPLRQACLDIVLKVCDVPFSTCRIISIVVAAYTN
jgi:symplekin